MKDLTLLLVCCTFILMTSCRNRTDCNDLYSSIKTKADAGYFTEASKLADSLKVVCSGSEKLIHKCDSIIEINERIRLDFSLTEAAFNSRVEKYLGKSTDSMLAVWDKNKWIEWKMIDGDKMYFNRAASNLVLLKDFYEEREKQDLETAADPGMIARLKHTGEIMKQTQEKAVPVIPVNMEITYTITVLPDAVPEGETIRCWMPFPKENHSRQGNVELLSTSEKNFTLAPDSSIHRSLYMEKNAIKETPTTFSISYKYTSSGLYMDPDKADIRPYDTASISYKKYTSEQLPNICFTENIRRIADEITSPGDNPQTIVRKTYLWFKNNIPWTGALEYSVMPNIPEYVIEHRRGDCGMQTFLYMSLLRYKGIPVRWQSGWMLPPEHISLHDWCEVYFEGTGWVPSDISYDLQASENIKLKEFFLSGIDSYRLIVNDGVAAPFDPKKEFLRSEPYDFQRGEVEWKGGNLYFDKWDYDMQIEYR
ncbi:MAG: transglutaminase-like domain-containing protein [Bacteroidia bacterium]|nr:transglutaminase-like domain-containing protein [Bacteroidia bacterium]